MTPGHWLRRRDTRSSGLRASGIDEPHRSRLLRRQVPVSVCIWRCFAVIAGCRMGGSRSAEKNVDAHCADTNARAPLTVFACSGSVGS